MDRAGFVGELRRAVGERILPQRLRSVARPATRRGPGGAGVLAVFQHLHAVDEDVLHAGGVLVRLGRRWRGPIFAGSNTTTSAK